MRRAAVFLVFACTSMIAMVTEARFDDARRAIGFVDALTAPRPTSVAASSRGYVLDDRPREVDTPPNRLRCDTSELVTYRGTSLRFTVPITLHPAFQPYVERFERLVAEVAIEHYGRAPRTLSHAGGYVCRPIRGERTQLSEHALGNAIDLKGFGFYGVRADDPVPADMPRHMRRSFLVRVEDHWASNRAVDAYHVRFWEKLRARLEATTDLFQVMLGPSFPGHDRHLHLDRAPFRYVHF